MKKLFLAAILIGGGIFFADAQAISDEEDTQSWNDVQLTVPLNERFDFFTSFTARFGKNISRLNEARYAAGIVYHPNKAWAFQPFYWFIDARNSRGQFRREHRYSLRVSYHLPFKKISLTHRSLFEYRRREPRNSFRYRPSILFDRDLPKKFIPKAKFFVSEEVFYDSILNKFSRNRTSVGITKILTKKLSLDVYYMRQNDGYSRPGDLNVIGTNWKIRL